jgi:hypothetical protein
MNIYINFCIIILIQKSEFPKLLRIIIHNKNNSNIINIFKYYKIYIYRNFQGQNNKIYKKNFLYIPI